MTNDAARLMREMSSMPRNRLMETLEELGRKDVEHTVSLAAAFALAKQQGEVELTLAMDAVGVGEFQLRAYLNLWDEFCHLMDTLGGAEPAINALGKTKAYRHLKDIQATEGEA